MIHTGFLKFGKAIQNKTVSGVCVNVTPDKQKAVKSSKTLGIEPVFGDVQGSGFAKPKRMKASKL
jgi:hypothetical protein